MYKAGDEKWFGMFMGGLYARCKYSKEQFTLERVCHGLCSPRMLQYLEDGERMPDKLLQDAIMDRMGVGWENYEQFLGVEAYRKWEARYRIQHCIVWEEIGKADRLLEEYAREHDKENVLERQFYLSMLALVRRCQKASGEELRELFEEAVGLAVPTWEQRPLRELALSVKELNLILEAEQYRKEGARAERYLEVMGYLDMGYQDKMSQAKIYPKAVYFLCRHLLEREMIRQEEGDAEKLLSYCNRALEMLRDNGKSYFLWEILDMREKLLGRIKAVFMVLSSKYYKIV